MPSKMPGGDRYDETNQYDAYLLREAVNCGYEQGFLNGRAARQDRWRSNCEDSYAYQGEYNYYFREDFRRGYEDGSHTRYQYGSDWNDKYTVLGALLGSILNMESLR